MSHKCSVFKVGLLSSGYVFVTNIPTGATDIQIIERHKTENILGENLQLLKVNILSVTLPDLKKDLKQTVSALKCFHDKIGYLKNIHPKSGYFDNQIKNKKQ